MEDQFGFLWIGADGLFKYDGYEIKPYEPQLENEQPVSLGKVNALIEDTKGQIWIGASNGLFSYERKADSVKKYLLGNQSSKKRGGEIYSLLQDKQGRIWAGGREKLYVLTNSEQNEFQTIAGTELGVRIQAAKGFTKIIQIASGAIYSASTNGLYRIDESFHAHKYVPIIQEDRTEFQIFDVVKLEGDLLCLATNKGLWYFNTQAEHFTRETRFLQNVKIINKLLLEEPNTLWVGTHNDGLFKYAIGREVQHFSANPSNSYSLQDKRVQSLYMDRFGNLWVGTMFAVHRINFKQQPFPFYQIAAGPYNQDNYTFRVMQDSLGGFWFRLINLGLGYSEGLGKKVELLLEPTPTSSAEEIKNFCTDVDGNVWVLTLTQGIYKFEKGKKDYQRIPYPDFLQEPYSLNILADKKNPQFLWFSTKYGLCRLNRSTYDIEVFPPTNDLPHYENDIVGSFEQASDGTIWLPQRYRGINHMVYFKPVEGKYYELFSGGSYPDSLTHDRTRYLKALPDTIVLVSTAEGLFRIDGREASIEKIDQLGGISTKNILSIAQEKNGNLWFTKKDKICRFDGNISTCFSQIKDIEKFIYWSVAEGKDGRLSFGGGNGLYSFYPQDIEFKTDTTTPAVFLTSFDVFENPEKPTMALELIKQLSLPFSERSFNLGFSGLYFLDNKDITYKYKLEPFESDWILSEYGQRTVTYTNLSPGNYTFRVIAQNQQYERENLVDNLRVKIKILPPWYRTWWAYGIWLFLFLGSLFYLFQFQLRRQQLELEANRLKELDQLKTRLYTNITHEFRTPLTIIQGMATKVEEIPEKWLTKGISMIQRSSHQLLRLVNQMLDLSKLESGHLSLNLIRADIIPFLYYLVDSFHSYADSKGVNVIITSEIESLEMDFDQIRITEVISNLISNAIKFTPVGGHISVNLKLYAANHLTKNFIIEIKDSGVGIEKESLALVFDRFYQAENSNTRQQEGFGIGLALTKELVCLMNGDIDVESELGKGTKFTVVLPVTQNASPSPKINQFLGQDINYMPQPRANIQFVSANWKNEESPLVLIIEDNEDVVRYIVSCLEEHYRLVIAYDGKQGLRQAFELVPDLIISDVMMPYKDGFEICSNLKQDIRTSHIPIILLTARVDFDSKLKGIEQGADAYLAKPFKEKELHIRIKTLLELRKKLQEKYTSLIENQDSETAELVSNNSEDQFIVRLNKIIMENLDEANFDISSLCLELGLSRTAVHNKIKALTGKSSTEYIRFIRLKEAELYLKNPQLSISEIAYKTGFQSPTYFSRKFKDFYGVSPANYRKNLV